MTPDTLPPEAPALGPPPTWGGLLGAQFARAEALSYELAAARAALAAERAAHAATQERPEKLEIETAVPLPMNGRGEGTPSEVMARAAP